jgi:hypothetical protein
MRRDDVEDTNEVSATREDRIYSSRPAGDVIAYTNLERNTSV